MRQLPSCSFVLAVIIGCGALLNTALVCHGAGGETFDANRQWTVELGGEVTGACLMTGGTRESSYFVCAGEKLVALDAAGRLKKDFHSAAGPIERLIPLRPIQNDVALVGYKNWESEILFFDGRGQQVGKKSMGEHGIDWVAQDDRRLLVGFNGAGGLRLFELGPATATSDVREIWAKSRFHNCWNTTLANFGGGYVAASSESGGDIWFFSADGNRMLSKKVGDVTSLAAAPVSATESIIVAINDVNSGREEIVGVRPDRVLFRVPAGLNKFSSNVSRRYQRIVGGKFVGNAPQLAVLRGDGSVVCYDAAGTPLSMLPLKRSRSAIEPGPRIHGRDTLLVCEGKSLSCYRFPLLPKEIAAARAAVKNPNAELLKISDGDTSDDLWARALWLSLSEAPPSSEELAPLIQAAIRRARNKAPLCVSFGDMTSGSNVWMNVIGGAMETMQTNLGKDVVTHAKELQKDEAETGKHPDPKVIGEIYKDSLVKSAEQILSQLNQAEATAADRSVVLYRAAVADDPRNKAAWFRLAYFSKGESRARAIAESIRLDPQNAFPNYLEAVWQFERGEVAAALKSVQKGNAQPVCKCDGSPLPEKIELRYPDQEWPREMGVVGRPIPRSAFAYFVGQQTPGLTGLRPLGPPNLIQKLRDQIYRKFFSEAERLEKQGKLNEAATWLEAGHQMGIQLNGTGTFVTRWLGK
ncbi:MAG TPA: hypothetical protein VMR25_14205 [Planctomycetaceae bacterium]|nr:hypothetical protein [Planctomycetaceae bacterium]